MHPRPNPWHLALVAPLLLVAMPAHAGTPTPEPRTADVEIVDTALPKNAQTARFSLTLEEQGRATLSLPYDGYRYDLKVRCQTPVAGKVPTSLEVHRWDSHPGAPLGVTASTDLAMALDQKKTVVSVVRPDGTRVEITLRVH